MINLSDLVAQWPELRENKCFLACSGGVDSMVLLQLLYEAGTDLTVIHVNYQLRGEDSSLDEALVRETCTRYGIPFLCRETDTRALLAAEGGNLQDVARRIRYAWFNELLADPHHRIVLAHHEDDQVETFFQHVARKSGIMGMAAMPARHSGILRPLLAYSKADIYQFAQQHGIAWREDLSNTGNSYSRNRLRNILLPELYTSIPTLKTSVLTLVKAFQETQNMLKQTVSGQVQMIREQGTWHFIDYDFLSAEAAAEVLRSLGIRTAFIDEITKLRTAQKGKKTRIDGFEITREADHFYFGKPSAAKTPVLHTEIVAMLPESFDKNEIYLDGNKIKGTLQLRTWQTGDRMQPVGMQGTKLISDILTEAKIPSHMREQALLVADDTDIHWCVGIKIGGKACADANTRQILKVSVQH